MPRFFLEFIAGDRVTVTGADASHIVKSLRMQVGDALTLCDTRGFDYECEIDSLSPAEVGLTIISRQQCENEPSLPVFLFQGLPKGEKMDWIAQKSVELGVTKIIPVLMERCVSRPDEKSARKKTERWQKIAVEAAKQSGRGILPEVSRPVAFKEALLEAQKAQTLLFCYEGGGEPVSKLVNRQTQSAAVFIGPEGGFSLDEVQAVKDAGGLPVTLGKRILRTETAPLAALSVLMLATGNME